MVESNEIVVVSGIPRSGTSLLMRLLQAGGMELVTDGVREADEDNPRGYFEYEPVKRIETESDWLARAGGKVVKIISRLLQHLPESYLYRVVFVRRRLEEVLDSQERMLARRGVVEEGVSREEIGRLFRKELDKTIEWLASQANIEVLYLSYNRLVAAPAREIGRLKSFLATDLDIEAMASVVDPALYRQRREP